MGGKSRNNLAERVAPRVLNLLSLFFNPPLLYYGNFQEIFLILLTSIGNGKRTEWSPSDYKIGRLRSVSLIL